MLPYSLAGQSLCPWRNNNPFRVGLGRWEKLATKEKLAQGLKFHLGAEPWIHCACLGAPWHKNWDGKCCRPRQASTTISGPTVLPSNFWLQTTPRDAWGKACAGTSALPQGDWVSSKLSLRSEKTNTKWQKKCYYGSISLKTLFSGKSQSCTTLAPGFLKYHRGAPAPNFEEKLNTPFLAADLDQPHKAVYFTTVLGMQDRVEG